MALIIDNREILTPVEDIVTKLRGELQASGSNKLRDFKIERQNITCSCPIHKAGLEGRPSCNILLQDRGSVPMGSVHCWSCGYSGTLLKFITDCLNTSYKNAKAWLFGFVDSSIIQTEERLAGIDLSFLNPVSEVAKQSFMKENELAEYEYIHPYMFQRKLTLDVINKFEVGYDPKTNALTFPVYVNGECLFVAKRNVAYKRFDMPPITPKPIYGLDYITDNEIIVCESVINALTCWTYGKQAIALFGTGSEYQWAQLEKLEGIRRFVLAFDGDKAGRNGYFNFLKNVKHGIKSRLIVPEGKDINDLTKDEFMDLYNTAI